MRAIDDDDKHGIGHERRNLQRTERVEAVAGRRRRRELRAVHQVELHDAAADAKVHVRLNAVAVGVAKDNVANGHHRHVARVKREVVGAQWLFEKKKQTQKHEEMALIAELKFACARAKLPKPAQQTTLSPSTDRWN